MPSGSIIRLNTFLHDHTKRGLPAVCLNTQMGKWLGQKIHTLCSTWPNAINCTQEQKISVIVLEITWETLVALVATLQLTVSRWASLTHNMDKSHCGGASGPHSGAGSTHISLKSKRLLWINWKHQLFFRDNLHTVLSSHYITVFHFVLQLLINIMHSQKH